MADSSRTIGKLLVDVDFNTAEIRAKLKSIGQIDSIVNRAGIKSDVDHVHGRLKILQKHIKVTQAQILALRKSTAGALNTRDSIVGSSKAVSQLAALRKAEQKTYQERIKASRDFNKSIISQENDLRKSRLAKDLSDTKTRNAQSIINARSQAKLAEIQQRASNTSTRSGGFTRDLTTMSNSLNRIDGATTRFLKKSALAFTAWSTGVTAAVGGFVAFSITKFAQLEQASVQAASVFSTDKFLGDLKRAGETIQSGSEKQFDSLIRSSSKAVLEQSKKVALDTLFSPTDIAKGLRSLAQAGFSQEESLRSIGITAKFAQNELLGVEDAVTVLGGAFASSGIDRTEKNFVKLTDQFTVAAAASQTSAKEIANAFSNSAAGSFKAYGQSVEQTLAVLSLFAKANKRDREAGTLSTIVIRDLTNAYTKNQEVFAKYGVQYGKAADGSVIPFTKTLLQLAKAQEEISQSQGAVGVSRFRKELGLTERASRGFSILYPQLLKDGQEFTDDVLYNLNNATGATNRIAKQQATTISFLFQNVMETIGNVLRDFGEQAAIPELRKLLEDLGGSGSEIVKLSPFLKQVGKDFGGVFATIREFVKSDAFVTGLKILYDAVLITLGGVRQVFRELGKAFGDGRKDVTGFVAFAETIRQFATISATILPVIARVIGEIAKFALENKSLIKTLVGGAVALTLFSKGLNLIVRPLDTLFKLQRGIVALNFKDRILGIAGAFGIYTKQVKLAKTATKGLAAAQAVQGVTGASDAAQGAGAFAKVKKAPIPKGGVVGLAVAGGVIAATAAVKGFNDELKRMEKQGGISKVEVDRLKKSMKGLGDSSKDAGKVIVDALLRPFEKFGRDLALALILINNGYYEHQKNQDIRLENYSKETTFLGKIKAALDITPTSSIDSTSFDNFSESINSAALSLENFQKKRANEAGTTVGAIQASDKIKELNKQTQKQRDIVGTIPGVNNKVSDSYISLNRNIDESTRKKILDKNAEIRLKTARVNAAATTRIYSRLTGNLATNVNILAGGKTRLKKLFDAMADGSKKARIEIIRLYRAANAESLRRSALTIYTKYAEKIAEVSVSAPVSGPIGTLTQLGDTGERDRLVKERNKNLVSNRNKQMADLAKLMTGVPSVDDVINDTTGGGGVTEPGDTTGGSAAEAYKRSAEDQARLDYIRLSGIKKIRAENKLLQKVLADSKGLYKANRFEILLLEDAASKFEKRIEKQTALVDKLTSSLDALKNTQIAGTKAFSDQLFAIDQQVKQLQLSRLDVLATGQTEESAPVKAIDAQIASLQTQSERVSLEESLQLDPLKRKLEETFNPIKELSFESIIKQFGELNTKIATQSGVLNSIEGDRDRINATVEASQKRFEQLDFVLDQQKAAMDAAKSAAESTASSYSSVGNSASTATAKIKGTNDALNKSRQLGTDSAKAIGKNLSAGVVHVNAGVNALVAALANKIASIGLRNSVVYVAAHTSGLITVNAFISGLNSRRGSAVAAANQISMSAAVGLRAYAGAADTSGVVLMSSFLNGMKRRMGDAKNMGKDTIAYYLHVTIPNLVRQLKGPLAYDATILVPAGEKIMDGFQSGLSRGFGKVAGFLKDVAPNISEQITADGFSNRLKPFMVDVALGKTPDPYGVFGDLLGTEFLGGDFSGLLDPSLSFLHPTLSLKDTTIMAQKLAALFGGGLNVSSVDRATGTLTSSGNVSAHTFGSAADIGTGGSSPTDASLELFAKSRGLLGEIFRQIIHNGVGLNASGGSFGDDNHFDHVHLEWIMGKGFEKYSKKIGESLLFDIPGASDTIDRAVAQASKITGVDAKLIAAIAKQESGFNPNAGSPAGAQGLMQLMPGTAASLGVSDTFDPFQSALGGAKYIKQQLKSFGNNLSLALAAYNAGPGAAQTALNSYPETINYVKMVKKFFKEFGGFREHGGPVIAGKKYLVGEKGPEIVSFDRPGQVYNNQDTRRMMQNSGNKQNIVNDNRVINVHSNATDPEAVARIVDIHTKNRLVGVTGL